jgi:CRP-like cAMP-binding protein/MFS family permease
MTVENERLKLVPHVARSDSEGRLIVEKSDGESFAVPQVFKKFFTLTQEGSSLAQMAQHMPVSQFVGKGRFETVARYLIFLHDRGLLAEKRAIRLAESLRPDHVWNQSLAFEELAGVDLGRFAGGKPLDIAGRALWIVFTLTGGLFLSWMLFRSFTSWRPPEELAHHAIAPLAALVAAFALGRSFRGLIQWITTRVITGSGATLRLGFDAVSPSLTTDDLSLARGGWGHLLGSLGAIMFLTAPVTVEHLFRLSPQWNAEISYFLLPFTLLLLLVELSPLRHSPVTEWLRALYNLHDRGSSERDAASGMEKFIYSVQLSLNTVWVVALGFFLIGPATEVFRSLRQALDLSARDAQLSLAVLGILFAVVLASFVDDLAGSSRLTDRRRTRKLWRRRRPNLLVDEAITQGHLPSREELEKLPLLRQLDPNTRAHLLTKAQAVSVHEGEAVCRQGGVDRSLFLILSGRCAVAKCVGKSRRKVVALLGAGAVFGETSFFIGGKRTADVIALEDSWLLKIQHDPKMAKLDPARSEELQLRIWFLQALMSSATWKDLPGDALDALLFAGSKVNIKAGQKVISEGEEADAWYFLVQGKASVVQNTKLINRMQSGDAFGEIALLNPDTLRTATVVADTDLLAVRIEVMRFWHLLGSHLPLGLEIERLAQKRLAVK